MRPILSFFLLAISVSSPAFATCDLEVTYEDTDVYRLPQSDLEVLAKKGYAVTQVIELAPGDEYAIEVGRIPNPMLVVDNQLRLLLGTSSYTIGSYQGSLLRFLTQRTTHKKTAGAALWYNGKAIDEAYAEKGRSSETSSVVKAVLSKLKSCKKLGIQ